MEVEDTEYNPEQESHDITDEQEQEQEDVEEKDNGESEVEEEEEVGEEGEGEREEEHEENENDDGEEANEEVEQSVVEQDSHEVEEEQEEEEEATENVEQHESEREENANQSDDEEFAGFDEEEIKIDSKQAKKRQIVSDDDDTDEKENDDDNDEQVSKKKKKLKKKQLNDEASDDDENVEQEHVEENEDKDEESNENEEENANEVSERNNEGDDLDDEVDDEEIEQINSKKKNKGEMTDLERVLSAQRAENKRKNRKRNIDSEELNEMDNKISAIITEMKSVASEDRASNEKSVTAIGKLKMLPTVVNMLQKSDYHATMIELGMLGAIAEWLAPLPDRSLSNIKIRENLIDALRDFGEINADYLKSSGIGKAVMFLYKHPKETKSNKHKLERLINSWSRPIFNLDSNFKQLTKEERLQRDMEHVRSLNRRDSNEANQSQNVDAMLNATDRYKGSKKQKSKTDSDKSGNEDNAPKALRPNDPGFCPRARVPLPSSKDYVNRPKSNIDNIEISDKKVKKSETLLSKHKKRFVEIQRNSKFNRAVTMSINK